jgi:hypothetical protein
MARNHPARNYLLPLIALSLIVLAGCGTGGQTGQLTDPFIGGNIALNLYLQNGAPPPQVYDGGKTPFAANIVIENVGEADIGPGTDNPYVTTRIEGILPSLFGVTDADLSQTLQERVSGAHKNFDGTILGGQPANFVFDRLNFQGKLQGNQPFTLRGTVCYDYSNLATTTLCLKNDILENVQDSTICTLTGQKLIYNSGGPLQVTNVVQNPLSSNKVQFNFMVEHVGPGEFYGRSDSESCNPSVRNTNKYVVDIEVTSQDTSSTVTCYRLNNGASGRVTMYNGQPQQLSCTITRSTATNARVYEVPVTIKTKYRYGQFIEQAILVQSVPE